RGAATAADRPPGRPVPKTIRPPASILPGAASRKSPQTAYLCALAVGYRISESVSIVTGARRAALVTSEPENVTNDVTVRGVDVTNHVTDRTENVTNVTDLNDRQAWAMSLIRKGQEVRVSMLVTQFKCSTRTAKRDLADLKELGLVRFVGSPRTGSYVLT
ncbi:MAG: DeoR family transcriptional regulator, partial [Planctomycetia bacterium]